MTSSFEGILLLLALISSLFNSTSSQCTNSDTCATTGTTKTGYLVYDMYGSTEIGTISNCPLSEWSQRQVLPLGKCLKLGEAYKVFSMTLSDVNLPENVYTQTYSTPGCTGSGIMTEDYGGSSAKTCTLLPSDNADGQPVKSYAIVSYVAGSAATWPGPPAGVDLMNYFTAHFYSAAGCAGTAATVMYFYAASDPSTVCTQTACSSDFAYDGVHGSGTYSLGTCHPPSPAGGGCTNGVCKSVGQKGYLTMDMYADMSTCQNKGVPISRFFSPGGACNAQSDGSAWEVNSVVQSVGGTSMTMYNEVYKSNTCTKSSFSLVSASSMGTTCTDYGGATIQVSANAKIGVPATGGPYEMR